MRKWNKCLSLILVMALVVNLGQVAVGAAESTEVKVDVTGFTDLPDDWSTLALENAIDNGLLKGDHGLIRPYDNITRAEVVTVITRAFGAEIEGDIDGFMDVEPDDWFASSIAKAYQMGIIKGSNQMMKPNSDITRQEVFVILARAMKIDGDSTINEVFEDILLIDEWAKAEMYAFVNNGYIQGSNGKLNPTDFITRAEFAQVLNNLIKEYIDEAGVYTTLEKGNIMINVPGVTLEDVTVAGDLIIGDGVGEGEVILNNVTVEGDLVVRGGGVNSIIIKGSSKVSNIIVAKVNGEVSVKVRDDANVEVIYIDDGCDDVRVEGTVGTIDVEAADIKITATKAKVGVFNVVGENLKVIVDESSNIGKLNIKGLAANARISVNGTVEHMSTQASKTYVTGEGTLSKVDVAEGGANATIRTANTEIEVEKGVKGVVGKDGQEIPEGTKFVNKDSETIVTPVTSSGGSSNSSSNNNDSSEEDNSEADNDVDIDVEIVTVTSAAITMVVNDTMNMTAVVTPDNATDKTIEWSVETLDLGTAVITTSGALRATGPGSVRVKATNLESGVSGTLDIGILTSDFGVNDYQTLKLALETEGVRTILIEKAITVAENETLIVGPGKTLVLEETLRVEGEIDLSGSIETQETLLAQDNMLDIGLLASLTDSMFMLGASPQTAINDNSKIEIIGDGSIRGKEGSSMKFDDFSDIITPSQDSVLLYEGAKIKVGDTQYIGNNNKGIIELHNFEGSDDPVAGFFLNGDGDLLLVIFEEAEIVKETEDILDIYLLVKAGENDRRPGELRISNFEILKDSGDDEERYGGIVIESNGVFEVAGESILTAQDEESYFNATGGDENNSKGIRFTEENGLNINIRGDVMMNKAFSGGNITAGGDYFSDLPASLDILFDPEDGDFVGDDWDGIPVRGKYYSYQGSWTMEIPEAREPVVFINDPDVIGQWESIDFVEFKDNFDPDNQSFTGSPFMTSLEFLETGVVKINYGSDVSTINWTKNLVYDEEDSETNILYEIREIDGVAYLFYEWHSGDPTVKYYVLSKR